MGISSYTADSFFKTLFDSRLLSIKLTHEMIPELTTTNLNGFLPGLVDKYGDDVAMALNISAGFYPESLFTKDYLGLNSTVIVDF